MRHLLPGVALTAALVLSGCGGDSSSDHDGHESSAESSSTPPVTSSSSPTTAATTPPTSQPSPTAPAPQVIEITFTGDTVEPSGDRIEVKADEPITLRVTADAPGELHVHSSPEQELSYRAGSSDLTVTFERPGIVDVESHDLGVLVVQLEVR